MWHDAQARLDAKSAEAAAWQAQAEQLASESASAVAQAQVCLCVACDMLTSEPTEPNV